MVLGGPFQRHFSRSFVYMAMRSNRATLTRTCPVDHTPSLDQRGGHVGLRARPAASGFPLCLDASTPCLARLVLGPRSTACVPAVASMQPGFAIMCLKRRAMPRASCCESGDPRCPPQVVSDDQHSGVAFHMAGQRKRPSNRHLIMNRASTPIRLVFPSSPAERENRPDGRRRKQAYVRGDAVAPAVAL